MAPVKIKVCGMTSLEDTLLAVEAGADAVGFIFYKKSPRCVAMKTVRDIIGQLPPFVETVGVFVDEAEDKVNRTAEFCGLDVVQLHGSESASYCKKIRGKVIKAVRVKDADSLKGLDRFPVKGFLLDTFSEQQHGGTGRTFDWNLVHRAKKFGPVILAGGLGPRNVREAIRRVRPYGVDACSGVECAPGRKDPEKIKAFIKAVRTG
jgi:phosphoribosylanthranilate isomerase